MEFQSSYPFLSVDYFIELSDIRILKDDDIIYKPFLSRPPILFIKTQLLIKYIPVLLQLDYQFILITGCNDDMCIPYYTYPCTDKNVEKQFNSLLECPQLITLYSKNISIRHDKIVALPIGPKMQWVKDTFFGENKAPLITLYNKYYLTPLTKFNDIQSKPNLLYININTGTTNYTFYNDHRDIRRIILNKLITNGFSISPNKDNEIYIKELQSHKFCLSPPGRGIDAHRTWEALMVGTIPICISSSLNDIYSKLPVLIVDDYSKLTTSYLLEEYEKIRSKTYDFSILYADYWKDRILNTTKSDIEISNDIGIYTAVMIEPRKHPAMRFVLNNFLENLDVRWNFIIYHGTDNEQWLKDLINSEFPSSINRITLGKIDIANLNLHQYSSIMVSSEFIQIIPTEMFLIFQTDSMISKPYKDLIYQYMDYDYVGAPWFKVPRGLWKCQVGNGGLSLRRRSKMLEIARTQPYIYGYPEDMYFSEAAGKMGMNKPSWEKAKEFSIETQHSPKSFGIHRAWLQKLDISEEQCPGYSELLRLNML